MVTTLTMREPFGFTCHPECIACRDAERGGLGLRFEPRTDGSVVTRLVTDRDHQGYPDRLHGGIVATLLDAAMTHCLFAREVRAYTARLAVRYERAVELGTETEVRARVVRMRPPVFILAAEIVQGGACRASARGVFHAGNGHAPA